MDVEDLKAERARLESMKETALTQHWSVEALESDDRDKLLKSDFYAQVARIQALLDQNAQDIAYAESLAA